MDDNVHITVEITPYLIPKYSVSSYQTTTSRAQTAAINIASRDNVDEFIVCKCRPKRYCSTEPAAA